MREDQISTEKLLLDPNNYRFQDTEDFVFAAAERLHEPTVQERAFRRLRSEESLAALKASVLRNGYIPVERLVVRPYSRPGDERWLVIEGNRRVAVVKWILDDHAAGVAVPESVMKTLVQLPVIIIEEDGEDEIFRASLMGIRHVGGIREWGGYQRAMLVYQMREDLGLDASEVGERLGMTTHEVNRRYRAFKALRQMKEQEDFEELAKSTLYPIFHEAVSLPAVKDWLGWDEEDCCFTKEDDLRDFHQLISPSRSDEGEDRPPKIPTYLQVRTLRDILPHAEAKRSLLDPDQSYEDALAIARQDRLAGQWETQVRAAIRSLENIAIRDLKSLSEEQVELLRELVNRAGERLEDHASLKGSP